MDSLGDRLAVEYGDSRVPQRIWDKLYPEPNTGCWLWAGSDKSNGYGQVHFRRRTRAVHVVVFELTVGEVPVGLELDHLCRVRWCSNPVHLDPVTRAVNLARGKDVIWMIQAAKTHCPSGHPYSGDNLGWDGQGRRCKTCDAKHKREYKERMKRAAR